MSISPSPASSPQPDDPAWQATRAESSATIIQPREEDETGDDGRDIGRQVSPQQRELFVSCDPAQAMQQQFDHLQPEFIALHDIGTASSRRLLLGIAAASGRELQKLVVRRQGYGTPLATLEFLDFPSGGQSLRLYTTAVDADTAARQQLALVLLNYSRLGVVMVGEMPPHLISSSLQALREGMVETHWHNRHLLLLPLSASTAITGYGNALGQGTGVNVRTTPQVTRPADAWTFISGSWNRLRETVRTASGASLPMLPGANTRASEPDPATLPAAASPPPLVMAPMPTVGVPAASTTDSPLSRYASKVSELAGMVSVAIFDVQSGQGVTHAGARPGLAELGLHGAALINTMTQASRGLGLGHAVPDAAITLGAHHLLVRPVPGHPGLAMHAVLDKSHANLTLARLQIQRLDPLLEPGAPTQ